MGLVISNAPVNKNKMQTAPEGSTSLASLIASDVAISWLAGEMASMMLFGWNFEMKKNRYKKIVNLKQEDDQASLATNKTGLAIYWSNYMTIVGNTTSLL